MNIKRYHRQRGVIILIAPLAIIVIALMSVLIVDGARLHALKAQMQSQVDAAASAAAGASQACGGDRASLQDMSQRALAAARAQGFTGDSGDLNVQAGLLEESPAQPGQLAFRPTDDLARSNSALVSYSRSEPISRLLPDGRLGRVTLAANAAVRKEVVATISAAGSTVGVDGGLLGALLGSLFDQPGYTLYPNELDSLGNTLLRVGDLLDALGVDSLQAALPLGADQLAAALRDTAGVSSPAGALAERLLDAAGIETVLVSDLISTVAHASVPGDTQLRAYDLLISLALNVARQQQLLNGSPLVISSPDILNLPLISAIDKHSLVLRLIVNRAPSVAIGPARQGADGEWLTHFYAPDISLELEVDAKLLAGSLASLHIPLAIDLGGGKGTLISAQCAQGTQNDVLFGIEAERQAVALGTGAIDPATGELQQHPLHLEVGQLELPGDLIPLGSAVSLSATVQGRLSGETARLETTGSAYPLFCDPITGCARLIYRNGNGVLGDLDLNIAVDDLTLLGAVSVPGLVTAITSDVTGLLESVVSSLLQTLVSPLLQALGVGIDGVQASVEAANQDGTQLIENVHVLEG